jgi:flagellar basal body-associated protein FliL
MAQQLTPQPLYKPSITRKLIALIFALLVLIIGVLFAVVSFHQASQGYKIVYSNTPPTTNSEPAYSGLGTFDPLAGQGQQAYKVPFTSKEIQNFYLEGFGSILATIILCLLAYSYSKITEIKNLPQPLITNTNMDTPNPASPIVPLNQTTVTAPPPRKSKMPFLIVLIVIVVLIGGYLTYSVMVARASSRDAKRRADVSQIQSALYLYINDHNSYPDSLAELTQPYKGQSYISVIPTAPQPADGPCTDAQNTYTYKKISPNDFQITYCIGKGGQLKNFITGKITTINPGIQTVSGR